MADLYLVPMQTVTIRNAPYRGPKYFAGWGGPGTIVAQWDAMDYGFLPTALLHTSGLSGADATFLAAQSDVYVWPASLDAAITDPNLPTFFEALQIPTNWLTPSTTYRQLLRTLAGLFQFMQRYAGLSNGHSLFEGGVTLETNYNQLTSQQDQWLDQTLASFGYPPVQGNPKLRALAKTAGDAWGSQSFILGSLVF